MTVMSCRWHSPPSSHTGQSCGWFTISHSVTLARNSRASGSSIEMRVPSAAGVMHAMTSLAVRVLLVLELLDGALAAGADRAQRRMPAEIRQVEAQREAAATGSPVVDGIRLIVDMDGRHIHLAFASVCRQFCLHGQRFSRMCRSKSSRKYFSPLCSGSAAPGASAQKVCPGPAGASAIASRSRSPAWPRPSSMSCKICRPMEAPPSTACTSRTIPARRNVRDSAACRPGRSGRRARSWCRCRAGCPPSAPSRNPSPRRGARSTRKSVEAPPGSSPRNRYAVAHAARVLLQNLADGRAHRQLPDPRALHPSAGAVQLGAAVAAAAQALEPCGAPIHDVRHVAERLDIIDDGRLAPEAAHLRDTAAWRADWRACLRAHSAAPSLRRTCSARR